MLIKLASLQHRNRIINLILSLSLLLLLIYPLSFPQKANATVTEAFVRFDRLATGATISGTACLKSTLTTQTNVVIVFPSDWTISGTASNWTVTTTNLPVDPADNSTTATAWPNIAAASGTGGSVNGLSVTFGTTGSGNLTAGVFYCFNFSGASSTVGAAGSDKTGQLKTQGGSPYTDSINYATAVVASGGEQITVTASVSATMNFALSGNTIALGTLSTSSVTSGNVTMTVGTNARNGFLSWIEGTSTTGGTGGGLHSTVANADIPSTGTFDGATSDLASTTGVVIDADSGTNTPTINAEYNGSNTTSGGHFDGALFHQMAYLSGAQAGTTVVINARSKIASTQTAASDYSDVLTITAAGSF